MQINATNYEDGVDQLVSNLSDLDNLWYGGFLSVLLEKSNALDQYIADEEAGYLDLLLLQGIMNDLLDLSYQGYVEYVCEIAEPTTLEKESFLSSLELAGLGELKRAIQFLDEGQNFWNLTVVPALTLCYSPAEEEDLEPALETIEALPPRQLHRKDTYIVQPGEDIRSVARNVLGSSDMWVDLVDIYHLAPPYFAQDSSTPRCLYPGARLTLPQGVVMEDQTNDEKLGATLALDDETWDLAEPIAVDASYGMYGLENIQNAGIDVVYGLDCLATELSLRLSTPRGDLDHAPTYGIDPLLHELALEDSMVAHFAKLDALREDGRVKEIAVNGNFTNSVAVLDIEVVPID